MISGFLANATGGWVYHWRALRYRRTLWRPFREGIARWLEGWRPPERALLLVGPSAGHCLPWEWLRRFDQPAAVEPDPVARRWFARRLGRPVRWWAGADPFRARGQTLSLAPLRALLAAHPGHAVLFCNFLGQLRFLDEEVALHPGYRGWKAALPRALGDRSWASFHDRVSGELPPALPGGTQEWPHALSDQELMTRYYAAEPEPGRDPELLDHLTGDLFADRPRRALSWEISPGHHHLVEAVRGP